MSASALARVQAAGLHLARDGDRLIVRPRERLTDDLRAYIRSHRDELLPLVPAAGEVEGPREALIRACQREGLSPDTILAAITGADLGALAEGMVAAPDPERHVDAYALAISDKQERMAGRVPVTETAQAICLGCGPVWTAPEVAAVAPLLKGFPTLLACPWCFVRHAGQPIPRPTPLEQQ